jgi:hypothetical protein
MNTLRTMPMKWSGKNSHISGPYCVACGRSVKPGMLYSVHVINGGADILHPQDEANYTPDAGEMGWHNLGPECRKQFGDFVWAHEDTT